MWLSWGKKKNLLKGVRLSAAFLKSDGEQRLTWQGGFIRAAWEEKQLVC